MPKEPGLRPAIDPTLASELRLLRSWNDAVIGEMSIDSLPCSTAQGWKKPRKLLELGVDGHAVRGRALAALLADAKLSNNVLLIYGVDLLVIPVQAADDAIVDRI